MPETRTSHEIVARAEALYADGGLDAIARWKAGGGRAVGCAPVYVPTELIDAAGALPALLLGAAPGLEAVEGDALFQSAICHLPRSLAELGIRGALRPLDLVVVPSTCDVLRNLTGMWKLLGPTERVHFLELPQRLDGEGVAFYRGQLAALRALLDETLGTRAGDDALRAAIARGNARRRAIAALFDLRASEPARVPTSELYLVLRAGALLPPAEHVAMLEGYLAARRALARPALDVARVVLSGAFCEQPPLGFLRTLERAGCAVVDDDLLLGLRWPGGPIDETGDPLAALARAYVDLRPLASCRYEPKGRRAEALLASVRERGASGVILAAPSFCDIALLDRPALIDALEGAGVPSIQLQYAENGADFGAVREQAGTFADALRLWGAA